MKKVFSVILAALLAVMCMAPAFAADGGTHSVVFRGPSDDLKAITVQYENRLSVELGEEYSFVACTEDGEFAEYKVDASIAGTDNGYVYYDEVNKCQGTPEAGEIGVCAGENGKFYWYGDILFDDDKAKFDDTRYMPVACEANGTAEDGEHILFKVMTNAMYDAATVVVEVNGEVLEPSQTGVYAVTADRDLVIGVREFADGNISVPVLMRNRYSVKMPTGDGYAVKTLDNQNNRYVYYGDDFEFRVKITKGFTGSGMKVNAVRGTNELTEFIEEAEFLDRFMGNPETLTSTGVDASGCRTYKLTKITAPCRISVSGVTEESKSGILAMLKKILRLILNAFGIKIPALQESVFKDCKVTIDANEAIAAGVSFEVTSSANKPNATEFSILTGEGVDLHLTKKDRDQSVRVEWTIGGKTVSDYNAGEWKAKYNQYTGETIYSIDYYIDGITDDATIRIIASN